MNMNPSASLRKDQVKTPGVLALPTQPKPSATLTIPLGDSKSGQKSAAALAEQPAKDTKTQIMESFGVFCRYIASPELIAGGQNSLNSNLSFLTIGIDCTQEDLQNFVLPMIATHENPDARALGGFFIAALINRSSTQKFTIEIPNRAAGLDLLHRGIQNLSSEKDVEFTVNGKVEFYSCFRATGAPLYIPQLSGGRTFAWVPTAL